MKMKKILSLFIAMAMLISSVGITAMAEESSAVIATVNGVECSDATAMVSAINSASGDVTVEIYSKVETGGFGINNSNITKLSFIGMDTDAEICVDGVSYIDVRNTDYSIEYTDLTLSHTNAGQNIDGFLPQYFSTYNGGNVTYKNCTFPNGVTACGSVAGTTYEFTDCTFNNTTSGLYSLWIYGNSTNVVVNGGVFCGVRGIKLYSEGSDDFSNLSVSEACFSDTITEKHAVVLTKGESVTLTDNTFNNSKGIVQVDDDYASLIEGKTVVIDGTEYVVNSDSLTLEEGGSAEVPGVPEAPVAKIGDVEYTDLHTAMTTAKAGETVELLCDVDLSGAEWEPVSFEGKFNGNEHTIKNLTINKPGVSNTGFITSLNATFEKVTFEDPTVTGGENTGVLAGRAGGSAAYAKDINVTGTIKVETTHSGYARAGVIVGGWAYGKYENITVDGIDKTVSYIKHTGGGDGRYVAGIVGHADDVDAYINCTVKNITISGGWLCGGIAGPGPSDGVATGCAVENIDMGADYSGGMFGWYYGAGTIEDGSVKNVIFTNGSTNNGAIGGYSNNTEATVTNVTIENVKNEDGAPLLSDVAKIGETTYTTLADAAAAATAGDTITLIADATIAEGTDVTIPDGVTLNGNGYSIFASGADHDTDTSYGYVVAGGNLTIAGITKIEKFSASYYDHVITIGEGASLEVFGKNRVSLGYGSSFYVKGTVADAKTANKSEIQPSLNISAGLSIVGGNDTVFEVKNAYVILGDTSSKNSNAGGKFDITFENSIVDFTKQFSFSTPKYDTLNPVFNVNIKDSVMTTGTKLMIAAPGTVVAVDNSTVTLGSYLRNSGKLTLENGSTLTGGMIQFGESGGNDGDIIVDGSTLTINNDNTAYAMDGKGTGSLTLKNGAVATIDYIKNSFYSVDNTSTLNVKELIDCEVKKEPVAKIGDTSYATIEEALKAATSGCTITLLDDITVSDLWDCRNNGAKITVPVTIDGNGKTLKLTGAVDDKNWNTVFRFEDVATVKNLTIDVSGATGVQRGISSKLNITAENCKFIGNGTSSKRAIIFGEGAGDALSNVTATITGCTFTNWSYGVSDNQSGKDAKSVIITESTFNNANALVSASESVTFTGNKVENGYVNIKSYTADNTCNVTAIDNTLDLTKGEDNKIDAGGEITAQEGFYIPASGVISKAYTTQETDRGRIWGDIQELKASESVVIKLYSGETLMATTTLAKEDLLSNSQLTYNIVVGGKASSSWNTVWEAGHPNALVKPDKVVLIVDGQEMNSAAVTMDSKPDNLGEVTDWKTLQGVRAIDLPTATVTQVDNSELTFAMTFTADDVTQEQLAYYGDWYADFELTVNKEGTFNANGGADGYLSGQYDAWSENWVNVPFENVTISANSPLKIMEYAAQLMNQPGLKFTYRGVYEFVKEFNCGVFFEEEYLAANPDLEVTLELRMYNPADESESYTIGETYEFNAADILTPVAEVNGTKYTTLQAALDAAAAGKGDVTVEILEDIDLTNVDWNPVTVSAPGYPVVTVNGNDKTITGLNDMLFSGTWAGGSGLIINDLTIANSTIVNDKDDTVGTVGVGAFIGYPQASATITLNNCHLVDSTVEGGHWTGGLIGIAGGYSGNDGPVFMNLTIKDCSVTGSTIKGKGSAGGISGHAANDAWTNVVIENTEVSGNTITSTGSSNNKAGAVMGTIGAAGQPATANGETKTGGVSVSATVSDNTVTSNSTPITTIYGRQGSSTGALTITGGTYANNPIEENVAYAQPKEGYEIVENDDGTYGLAEKEEVELFDIYAANVTLGNSLAMNFAIKKSDIDGTDYYAEIKHYAESETETTIVEFKDWTVDSSGNYYVVTYPGLTAKQVVDDIDVTIYRKDSTKVSNVWKDGLKAYALRMMDKTLAKASLEEKDVKLLTVLADMLNYGAAAQREFTYKVNTLATDGVDEEYMAYASEMPELSDISDRDMTKCFGSTLSLKDSIILKAAFKGVTEGMSATVSFKKHNSEEATIETITYEQMEKDNSFVIINVDDLVIADAKQLVTITIYDAEGNEYTVFKDSMNSYIKRNIADGDESGILEMTAKFTASAYNTLH